VGARVLSIRIPGVRTVTEYRDWRRQTNPGLQRRGRAYAVVVRGAGIGPTSDIVTNLTSNTGGTLDVINTANSLADRMKAIAARISNQP